MNRQSATRVLVAGIGGASLGTEIVKCLRHAGRYRVFGCDISPLAYGHLQIGAGASFVIDRLNYESAVLDLCQQQAIRAVIPGGEEPLALLACAEPMFRQASIVLAMNNAQVTATCLDKARLFQWLSERRFPAPWTTSIEEERQMERLSEAPFPCVVKPATESGGSRLVGLAANRQEAELHVRLLLQNALGAVIQEYLPHKQGEYTIGVLSRPDGQVVRSTVLKRLFHTRLSTRLRSSVGMISSGFSQGLIDEFPKLARQAEQIAEALGSTGPLNIQARLRGATLVPFEINPRFSASTFLRTMAGFNEIDAFLGALLFAERPQSKTIKPGYYLRSFDQAYAPPGAAP